jgi:hypothetical protein
MKIKILILLFIFLLFPSVIAYPTPDHRWNFDEDGTDEFGGVDLTEQGGISYSTTRIEGTHSAILDGSADYFSTASFTTGYTNYTFCTFVSVTDSNSQDTLFSENSGTESYVALRGDIGYAFQTRYPGNQDTQSETFGDDYFGVFQFICYQLKSGAKGKWFVNGTPTGIVVDDAINIGTPNANMNLGRQIDNSVSYLLGLLDVTVIWLDQAVTPEDILELFNEIANPPAPPPTDEQKFTITATDTYDGSSLNNLTVTVFNSSNQFNYNTENGTIIISNKTGVVLAFNRSLYNLSIAVNDSGGYFNKSFGSINITDGGNFTPDLYQAVLYITAKDVLNNSVGDFLASVPLQNAQAQASSGEPGIICVPSTNCSGTSILYLRAQNYNITGNKTLAASMLNYGFLNTTSNITINAKDSVNIELEFYSNILTINATSIINNNKILNFDINTVGIDVTFNNIQSTTTGQIQLNLMGGNYNLSFGGVNYSNTYKVININSSDIRPNFTFTPYVYNSVNISIFDEILGRATNFFNSKIVNIELVSDIFSQNYTTTTGTFYADLLSPSDYKITYSSADYGKRDYYFNLENKTHNDIELYLLSNTNSTDVTFTIVDNTGAAIENATINLKRYYVDTNSYRTVAMARTNVEGQGVIDTHFNNAFYQILAEKGSFFTNTIGAKIFTNTLAITIATTPDIFEDLDIVNNVLTNLTFNNNTGVFSYVFNHLAGTNVKGRLLVQRTESGKTETICDNSDISSGATVLCPATIVGDKEYYKATGFIDTLTGNTEYITDVLDFDNWADTVLSTFKSSGVFLSIIFAGTIASLGLASPGISIAMFLVGLLGIVFFGFAPLSITIYISIAIIGGIIIYRLKS